MDKPLPTIQGIPFDTDAFRGEYANQTPAGWIVIYNDGTVNNKLFPSLHAAAEYCQQVHPDHKPIIKGLRKRD